MSVSQYLQYYAEKDIALAETFCQQTSLLYQHVLTIPAFNEPLDLVAQVKRLNTEDSVLIIFILNVPDKIDQQQKIDNTQQLGQALKANYPSLKTLSPVAHLLELNQINQQHLLLVEHCHEGQYLPLKEGVGLARKIACDLACELIYRKRIESHWIHISDADVSLPSDYFSVTKELSSAQCVAAVYPFLHQVKQATPRLQQAQQLYDISLQHYVEGLLWAQSPYAFHTIGSTLLVHYKAYAQVRGFPKRAAGEDFYLLNKLAKVGKIISLKKPVVEITVRESDRVPFGTGPALTRILQLENPLQEYRFYHPQCFVYLQQWLQMWPILWLQQDSSPGLTECLLNSDCFRHNTIDLTLLVKCLTSLNTDKALKHAYQNSNSEAVFLSHMHHWFDALKTLKFIHYLRNNQFPSVNFQALKIDDYVVSENLKNQLARLK